MVANFIGRRDRRFVQNDAVENVRFADRERIDAGQVEHRLQDHHAGHDDGRAARIEPDDALALRERDAVQLVGHPVEHGARDDGLMHAGGVVHLHALVDRHHRG
ncbi:MAG: hypothetical protein ACLU7P_09170, partial [Eggerthella lenta]